MKVISNVNKVIFSAAHTMGGSKKTKKTKEGYQNLRLCKTFSHPAEDHFQVGIYEVGWLKRSQWGGSEWQSFISVKRSNSQLQNKLLDIKICMPKFDAGLEMFRTINFLSKIMILKKSSLISSWSVCIYIYQKTFYMYLYILFFF